MDEDRDQQSKILEIRSGLARLNLESFFERNFGLLNDPRAIAERMLHYRKNPHEMPQVAKREVDVEDAKLKLIPLLDKVIQIYESEDWADEIKWQFKEDIKETLDTYFGVEVDRTVYEILDSAGINYFVLRFIPKKEIEVHLNDELKPEEVKAWVVDIAFKSLDKDYTIFDTESFDEYVDKYIFLAQLLQAYPISETIDGTRRISRLDELEPYPDQGITREYLNLGKQKIDEVIKNFEGIQEF